MTRSRHPSPHIQARVEDLRRRGVSWVGIAAIVKCARRQIDKHYRPHLPPELQAPLGMLWRGGAPLKTRIWDYLDEHGDTKSQVIAKVLEAHIATVDYHVAAWRAAQAAPVVVEPPRRCVCGLGLWNGELRCALCEMQKRGLVVVYAVPGWAVEVGEYLAEPKHEQLELLGVDK